MSGMTKASRRAYFFFGTTASVQPILTELERRDIKVFPNASYNTEIDPDPKRDHKIVLHHHPAEHRTVVLQAAKLVEMGYEPRVFVFLDKVFFRLMFRRDKGAKERIESDFKDKLEEVAIARTSHDVAEGLVHKYQCRLRTINAADGCSMGQVMSLVNFYMCLRQKEGVA